MVNKPKRIGTAAETAVVRALHAHGFPHAERRALRGHHDAGDITGTPGIVWEVKGGETARRASDDLIDRWLGETEVERVNAQADYGVLVVQRPGIGPANAHRWWAIMPIRHVAQLTSHWPTAIGSTPVRMTLVNACDLLTAAGYGATAVQDGAA